MANKKRIRALLIFFIILSSSALAPKMLSAEEKLAFIHGPYLLDPSENAVTVVWITNVKCVSKIEYGTGENFRTFPTWGSIVQTASSSSYGLIDANTKIHKIRITGLKPGHKYRYRLVSKQILQFNPYEVLFGDTIVSDVYQFETLNRQKVEFLFGVATDIHGDAASLDTLLQQLPIKSLDMMFFTGDILSWVDNEEQIFDGFLDMCVNHFAKEIPLIFLRGNHETRGHFARNLMQYFPHSSGRFYYSFNHGPVHFILLDSGEDKPDSHPVYAGLVDFDRYRDEQAEWLKKDIQSELFKNALYKIVLCHIPPFMGGRGHGEQDITQKWGPILNEAGIDLMFSGHKHRYSFTEMSEDKSDFPIVIIGKNMIVKTAISTDNINLTITNKNGELVDKFSVPSKK